MHCIQTEVLLFPDFLRARGVTAVSVPALLDSWPAATAAGVDNGVERSSIGREMEFDMVEIKEDAFIFVCNHMKRDKRFVKCKRFELKLKLLQRCGVAGPLIIDEFKAVIAEMGLENKVCVFE